ncbi:nuclease-related domain-containing protein [Escherichia coli]|nr:nuclease-related domain-containing protein [Escherichia coli]
MQVFDLLRQKRGEFDLVIVTHCNVIIVELKDWNHQPVTARGDTWFKGDKNMGRSPVSVTRSKNSCWTKNSSVW